MTNVYDQIDRPTLLLDRQKVVENIRFMAEKATDQEVRFRPHFKTHQSAEVGSWFRPFGVKAITASSIEMADYFARQGWDDITVAFPVNLRQVSEIQRLASKIRLGLVVESPEAVQFLASRLRHSVDIWIKVDVGTHRTGLAWDRPADFLPLVETIRSESHLRLRGLLSHAGHTYQARSPSEACAVYQQSVQRLIALRELLRSQVSGPLELSVGDTPGCTTCSDFGPVDEIRPGNFVFFDGQQLSAGVCRPEQVAAVVACPVVAKHPERLEVVVFGGAVHLSKDTMANGERRVFGLVASPTGDGWSAPIPGACVVRLSQEHGVVELPAAEFDLVQVGDLLCIVPAHVCLTVSALGRYRTLDGSRIHTFNCE